MKSNEIRSESKSISSERKEKERKLEKAITDAFVILEEFKVQQRDYENSKDEHSKRVSDALKSLGIKEYEFVPKFKRLDSLYITSEDIASVKLKCARITRRTVEYLPEKIREKFDKEFCNEIIQKEYSVNDMYGLTKYLKSCGVDPSIFRKFIDVYEAVDKAALDKMFELGDLKVEDLKGCYTVKESKPYISIKLKKETKDKVQQNGEEGWN